MKSGYQIGELVNYSTGATTAEGQSSEKFQPLIVISEPNSKGDCLAVAGSTRIDEWLDDQHILITPEMVLDGSLGTSVIFPVSNQILMNRHRRPFADFFTHLSGNHMSLSLINSGMSQVYS